MSLPEDYQLKVQLEASDPTLRQQAAQELLFQRLKRLNDYREIDTST